MEEIAKFILFIQDEQKLIDRVFAGDIHPVILERKAQLDFVLEKAKEYFKFQYEIKYEHYLLTK